MLPCLTCFATSPVPNLLETILVTTYWESMVQCYEVYQFNGDGTGYIYELSPEYYEQDRVGLAHTLRHGPDESCIRNFRYQIQGNDVIIDREDFDRTVTVTSVTKKDSIDWDLGVVNRLPAEEPFFYEVGFKQDEMGMDNAVYFTDTYIPTGRTLSEIEEDAEEEPSLEVDDEEIPKTVTPAHEVESMEDTETYDFDIFGQIQSFFDRLAEWFANFFSSLF